MTTLDIAVLFEKAIILNGILANAKTPEEKRQARKEMEAIIPQLMEIANMGSADKLSRPFLTTV